MRVDKDQAFSFEEKLSIFIETCNAMNVSMSLLIGVKELKDVSDLQVGHICSLYAEHVVKDRFPRGEPYIALNTAYSIDYMKSFGSFSLGEQYLLEEGSPSRLVRYCMLVKGRWPEAELLIQRNRSSWADYEQHFSYKAYE